MITNKNVVESKIGPIGGFGLTPGKLLILSKSNPSPKSEATPARTLFLTPNLWNPRGRFDSTNGFPL